MVDGDVVRQAGPTQCRGEGRACFAEGSGEQIDALLEPVELEEAVHDANAEPAGQERPGTMTPRPVLGAVPEQARDVVAAVVVDGELATAGSEHPIRLGRL